MLELLINLGVKKGFFEFNELGKLEKSCCSKSKLEVIDFDKTKEKMVAVNLSLQPPKSSDALKILPQLNRVDFIELKGFKKFIQYDKEKKFEEKIKEFNLEGKIRDSLFVLEYLIKDKNIQFTKEEVSEYYQAKKNYLIIVDVERSKDPLKDRDIGLIFLSLDKNIGNIPGSPLHNLNKPKLLSCNQIDCYYQELLSKEIKHQND